MIALRMTRQSAAWRRTKVSSGRQPWVCICSEMVRINHAQRREQCEEKERKTKTSVDEGKHRKDNAKVADEDLKNQHKMADN